MKGFLRSKPVLGMATLLIIAAVVISFAATGTMRTRAASSHRFNVNPVGGLDCNGYSATGQKPLLFPGLCADPRGVNGEPAEDNGHYVGHDEPAVQFNSNTPRSGNNIQYTLTLPSERPLPATQTFENQITFWFSMVLCDPNSFPQGACTPDSDTNNPNLAGSAILELQFSPPGFGPRDTTGISCDTTRWCAVLTIDSEECTANNTFCNPNCFEPINFAFIQRDGIPTGPPAPANQNAASETPNAQTLLMNQGDQLKLTIKDTPGNVSGGVTTTINDLATGQSGFMIASAANGFQNTDVNTCNGTDFSFHPEFSSAGSANVLPWGSGNFNIGFSSEIGHFEAGANGDNDSDDAPCFPTSSTILVAGCTDQVLPGDLDFDGTSYQADWPDGSGNNATSVRFTSPLSATILNGSSFYLNKYPTLQFETTVVSSEPNCQPNGTGCTVPPPGASFYPYYSVLPTNEVGGSCLFLFGNNTFLPLLLTYGKDAQYGTVTPTSRGAASGGPRLNVCGLGEGEI